MKVTESLQGHTLWRIAASVIADATGFMDEIAGHPTRKLDRTLELIEAPLKPASLRGMGVSCQSKVATALGLEGSLA